MLPTVIPFPSAPTLIGFFPGLAFRFVLALF
jgi:hypothetical protein